MSWRSRSEAPADVVRYSPSPRMTKLDVPCQLLQRRVGPLLEVVAQMLAGAIEEERLSGAVLTDATDPGPRSEPSPIVGPAAVVHFHPHDGSTFLDRDHLVK